MPLKLARSGNQEDRISETVSRSLLADTVDILSLRRLVAESVGEDSADQTIFEVVRAVNDRFFSPICRMELVLVEGCNFACSYCFESAILTSGRRRRKTMSDATIRRALDLLFSYSRRSANVDVVFFGGEPTLHMKGVKLAAEYAESKAHKSGQGLSLNMTSNGTLFDEEMVSYFADHKIKVLLSIDGLRETHDQYRIDKSGAGTFDRVLRGLKVLKRVQPWIGVKITVMPSEARNLVENVKGLYDLGVNQFLIGHATGAPWTASDREVYRQQLIELRDWYRSNKRVDLKISDFDDGGIEGGCFGCGAARSTVAVSAAGEISGCSRIVTLRDDEAVGKLGDAKYGLYNIVLRQQMGSCSKLIANCENEGIASEYRGGCFSMNYEHGGDLFAPSLIEHEMSMLKQNVRGNASSPTG